MARDRNELLERLLQGYQRWYNIERTDAEPLAATAEYHEETAGYILSKKARTWEAARHEYIWFYSVPHLTRELAEQLLKQAVDGGNEKIHPRKGHMSSYIVAVFLTDQADEDAAALLKKCRIRKSFRFSLYGWMEVQTAMIVTGEETVTVNGAGRNTAKFIGNMLHPPVRHKLFKKE